MKLSIPVHKVNEAKRTIKLKCESLKNFEDKGIQKRYTTFENAIKDILREIGSKKQRIGTDDKLNKETEDLIIAKRQKLRKKGQETNKDEIEKIKLNKRFTDAMVLISRDM